MAATKQIQLTMKGKPFDAVRCAGTQSTVVAWLNTSKDGELFEASDILAACPMPENTLRTATPKLRDAGYCARIGRFNYYGKPATIAELKRRIGAGA